MIDIIHSDGNESCSSDDSYWTQGKKILIIYLFFLFNFFPLGLVKLFVSVKDSTDTRKQSSIEFNAADVLLFQRP